MTIVENPEIFLGTRVIEAIQDHSLNSQDSWDKTCKPTFK